VTPNGQKTAPWLMVALVAASCEEPPPPPAEPKPGEGECFTDIDCSDPDVCFDVECLRRPSCRDASAETPCPMDCVGFCADPNRVGYCATDDDCAAYELATCRFDSRFCVDDRRTPEDDCIGWCVGLCFLAVMNIASPETGLCYAFPDSCSPPGFPYLTEGGLNCISL